MWIYTSQLGTEQVIEEDYVSAYVKNMMGVDQPQELVAFLRKLQNSLGGFLTLQGKIQWIEEREPSSISY
jgi:hypothetical protein